MTVRQLPHTPVDPVELMHLGQRPYAEVHALQRTLRDEHIAGQRADTLLLVEHPPVITLGRSHTAPSLRAPLDAIQRLGIPIVPTERGGDITYHGPGQLVGYGIIGLPARRIGVVDYVAGLEQMLIDAIATFGLAAGRRPGARGVWLDDRKIASIGIAVRRGVTMHGFALNVDPDMAHFELINPCGLDGIEMTSIARESASSPALDMNINMDTVTSAVCQAFVQTFGWPLAPAPPAGEAAG